MNCCARWRRGYRSRKYDRAPVNQAKPPLAPVRFGRGLRRRWLLDPDIHFLNHGSFGATPRRVLVAQDGWRRRLERQPVRFMTEILPSALRAAAARLAGFLGACADDLVFVDNATAGVNAILRSFPWRRGDELLLGSHAYPAVKNTARFVSAQSGIRIREVAIALPVDGSRQLADAYMDGVTARTRLAIVDHVASPSALVFPVREIVSGLRKRGVAVLIDGAHAPGMLPLGLDDIGADWYVGNCHKWLFAPKGCAFLWASPERQEQLHPLTISNHYGQGYVREFGWTGTRDPSAWLVIGAALDFYRDLGGARLRKHNHALAMEAAKTLSGAWHVPVPAPAALYGSMVAVPAPGRREGNQAAAMALNDRLWRRHRIEVPVFSIDGRLYLRVSAQAYNELEDYLALAEAIRAL